MIIPISTQDIKVGDVVTNIKLIDYNWYRISPGHEFIVTDFDSNYACFVCEDTENKLSVKMYKKEITKKVSLSLAKKEHTLKVETAEYKETIKKYCPNKITGYEDRETYDACSLKKYRCGDYCTPELECSKYLAQEDINKSKVLSKHLRINKIDKLNNK